MFQFIPESVKTIVLGVIATVIVLGAIAKRRPDIAWLQRFRLPDDRLTPPQKERLRRSQNVTAGVELILLGMVVPMGYAVLTMMFFNTPDFWMTLLTGVISVVCIALGVVAIVKR
jgi:hypothetical protein